MIHSQSIARRPEDVGIDSERLEAVFARAQRDVDQGKLPSAQVAVARQGKIAGIRTFGRLADGSPATNETLYCIYSSTKGFIASAVWLLIQERLLRIDERVADIIPEFATNGKESITVEQLLLHAGGFPYAPLGPPDWADSLGRRGAFARWRTSWEPGSRFEYHPTSAHWVIAEIIETRSGTDYRRFVQDQLTRPLGLDEFFLGLPEQQDARVAEVKQMAPPVEPPGGWRGVSPDVLLIFNTPEARRVGVPGGGAITGAGELALFYQALIHGGQNLEGMRVLAPESIEYGTKVRSDERHVDPLLKVPVNRGLSIIVAGDDGNANLRGFGRETSARAFGHGGAGGQIAWGDPETGISVGYVTNGLQDWLENGKRTTAISSLAAQAGAE